MLRILSGCTVQQHSVSYRLCWGLVQRSAHSSRSQSGPKGHGAVSRHGCYRRNDQFLHRWEGGIHLKKHKTYQLQSTATITVCKVNSYAQKKKGVHKDQTHISGITKHILSVLDKTEKSLIQRQLHQPQLHLSHKSGAAGQRAWTRARFSTQQSNLNFCPIHNLPPISNVPLTVSYDHIF